MTVIGEVFVAVRAATGGFAKDVEDGVVPGIADVAKKAATLLGGAFVATKIVGFAKEGIEELKEAAAVTAQTEAAIRSTGGAANVTADDIAEMSGALLELSGTDDELIAKGANLLLTFTNVRNAAGEGNDVFNQATKAALDLSTAGFGSMESASVLLGKALNDPVKGVTALQRVGVALTESQKESVKQLVATGDTLGAQKIILEEVNRQVGGSAEAFGKTLPGQLAIAQQSIENTKATFVAGLAPALEVSAGAVQFLTEKFAEQPEVAQQVEGGLLLVTGAVGAIAKPLNDVVQLWSKFSDGAKAAAEVAKTTGDVVAAGAQGVEAAAATASTVATQAQAVVAGEAAVANTGLGVAAGAAAVGLEAEAVAAGTATVASEGLLVALGPLGIAAAAIAATIAVVGLINSQRDGAQSTDDYTRAILDQNGALDENVDKVTANVLAHNDVAVAANAAGLSFRDQFVAVREGTDDFGAYRRVLVDAGSTALATTANIADGLRDAGAESTAFGRTLLGLVESGDLTAQQAAALVTQIEKLHNGYSAGQAAAANEKDALDGIAGQATTTQQSIEGLTAAFKDQSDALRAQLDPFFGVIDATQSLYDAQIKANDAQTQLNRVVELYGPESEQAAAAQRDLNAASLDAAQQAAAYENALRTLTTSVINGETSVADAEATLKSWVDQGVLTADQAAAVAAAFSDVDARADALNGKQVTVTIVENFERNFRGSDPDHAISVRGSGGPVVAGQAYLVGDTFGMQNAELFVPSESGMIIPPGGFSAVGVASGGEGAGRAGPLIDASGWVNTTVDPELGARANMRRLSALVEALAHSSGM